MMIPEWIWRLPFMQRERTNIFATAQKDMMETMADDIDDKAEELSKKKLMELLTVVNPQNIVSFAKNERAIYIGGERADEMRLANLKAEADAIVQMDIWKLIFDTPKELAHRAMFQDGESLNHLLKGRAVLYTLDTQKRIVETLQSYQPPKK